MTLSIAVLGLDHWYAAIPFARAVADNPSTELALVVDADPSRAQEVADELQVPWSTDFESALAHPGIDAVACFTSVDRSPELCITAAGAGKHIVAVKPLALTRDEGLEIVRAVEAAGVFFVPSEARRTSPLARKLSRVVHSGSIGDLVSGTFMMHSSVPSPWRDAAGDSWWLDPQRTPGGGWIDHAVYQIDRMRWLFQSDVANITGIYGTLRRLDLRVDDYGHAIITLDSGAVVTIEDTWIGNGGDFFTSMHLVGTLGSIHADTRAGTFDVANNDGWRSSSLPTDTFDTLDVLLRAVTGEETPTADVHTALSTLDTALRFYENAVRL